MYVSMSTQTRHSVAEVPLEVWRIIASFLSSEDVKKLYGINKPLSALAMEQRYRSFSIGSLYHDNGQVIRALQRLAYVHCFNHFVLYEPPSLSVRDQTSLAEYVRCLTFHPAALAALLPLNRGKYWMKKTLKTLGMLSRHETAFVVNPKTVLNIISNLSFVTSLTLDCTHWPGYPTSFRESLPLIAAGWASFGQNLQWLDLIVPLDAVHDTISSVKLPNLRGLSLDFSLWSRATDGSQIFVDFIHDHADTLRYLGIYTREYLNLFKTLLQDIRIPMLDSFTFNQAHICEQIDIAGLQPFLSTHSGTLKTLYLQFDSYMSHETWFTIHITLPKLQSLDVGFYPASDYHRRGTLDYVAQYSCTLVYLDMTSRLCSYNQIDELATQFSNQGRLRGLRLRVKNLTPQLLVLLSSKLPFLEYLTLKFDGLLTQEGKPFAYYFFERAEVSFCCHSVMH